MLHNPGSEMCEDITDSMHLALDGWERLFSEQRVGFDVT